MPALKLLNRRAVIAFVCLALSAAAWAAQPSPNESMQSLLERHTGKTVTLRLVNGEDLKGKVLKVQGTTVHLERLHGREYEDAWIDTTKVVAVIARVREKL